MRFTEVLLFLFMALFVFFGLCALRTLILNRFIADIEEIENEEGL
jgi:hypothetical protein